MILKHPLLALSFLTRIPVPDLGKLDAPDFARAALFYPLVGLLIGGLLCLPALLFPHASPLLLAAILTVFWAAITGGLHLDGLADSADAWLGGFGDAEKTQRILKDPLVGAAGVIAIVGVLLLKFAALAVLLEHQQWQVIGFAPLLGRTLILLLFVTTPYVRAGWRASQRCHCALGSPRGRLAQCCHDRYGLAGVRQWAGGRSARFLAVAPPHVATLARLYGRYGGGKCRSGRNVLANRRSYYADIRQSITDKWSNFTNGRQSWSKIKWRKSVGTTNFTRICWSIYTHDGQK